MDWREEEDIAYARAKYTGPKYPDFDYDAALAATPELLLQVPPHARAPEYTV